MAADPTNPRRMPLRDAIAETLLRAGAADPAPELHAELHAELRALLARRETPAERLFTRYRGRPSRALRRGRWTDGIPAAAW
jgi:hypothetical protein